MHERRAVLAISDSPVLRQLLANAFSKEADLTIATAVDWRHAERRLLAERADIAVLCSDRLRPDDDGAGVLRDRKIPLVFGAVDVRDMSVQTSLVTLVARVRESLAERRSEQPASRSLPRATMVPYASRDVPSTRRLVVVGASAGGTMALKSILQELPPRAPPMLIVQHMSDHFTGTFAQGLARICAIDVREAEDGDALVEGCALIAPGNRHVAVERRDTNYFVAFADGPPVSRHRPSVNVLFRSAAQEAGPNAVGVVLTGMGDDGADGLFEMKELGAFTIAQNEATSVVFGMPRAAIIRGGVHKIVPLGEMSTVILKSAGYRARSSR